MVGNGGKKVEGDDENSEQIDGELVPSIGKPKGIQDELEKEASDEDLEIDQKHNETRKPVYDKRNGIIQSVSGFWRNTLADIVKELRTLFNKDAGEAEHMHMVPTSIAFVAPQKGQRMWGTPSYNQVSEEEMAEAYVYKMDRPWLRPEEVRVEIRWGHALWVIGQGDEPVKVELPRIDKMRVSEATASMNADGVLTVVIPKRHGPQKWYEYKDLVFARLKTVRVGVSS